MLAISAMILPGISGSFILLLLGKYHYAMTAVSTFDIKKIALIGLGAAIGLLSFSKVLKWLLKHRRSETLALLTGFMLGSLNKVWPWKQTIEAMIDRHGKEIPVVQNNILPHTFESVHSQPAHLWYAIAFMALGLVMVMVLEKVGQQATNE